MKTQNVSLTTTVLATADLPRQRFVGFGGAVCAAGGRALGVAETSTAVGGGAPVNVLGVLLIEAGGVVAVEGAVESDASGRAVASSTGSINGYALDAATGAGETIRIVRGI